MPKRTKDELLAALRGVLGENQTDEAIALIEDVTDTFDAPAEDWEQKYKDKSANIVAVMYLKEQQVFTVPSVVVQKSLLSVSV